ncbi:hypothetical protein [Candidatus Uabimicrobium amorphum]|uniref:Uncharacterized protein n=1 Tax=Uabimicrobium amorphum TaxID=2596890 RepID=A0A5S9IIN7_UABAM|nr:hypothetical protein [Candidatus Uabimicrobium amorphum]BBM82558.1 hypothetical protein UABAM_00901 [Candidatus Uabimicrobium amorphum]
MFKPIKEEDWKKLRQIKDDALSDTQQFFHDNERFNIVEGHCREYCEKMLKKIQVALH